MPLSLVPLREEMSKTVTVIYFEAFDGFPPSHAMSPQRDAPVYAATEEANRIWIRNKTPEEYFYAVIDSDLPSSQPGVPEGEVIAFCKWKHVKADSSPEIPVETPAVPGRNQEAAKEFFAILDRAKAQFVGGKDYLYLTILATSPKHQGRGAAKLCLEFGVKLADELGIPAFLDASSEGRRVYEKYGFEMVGTEEMDLRPYGVDHTHSTCAMLRPAKGM